MSSSDIIPGATNPGNKAAKVRKGPKGRRRTERRRLVDPTTCERDYTDEDVAFMKAMDEYKRLNHRPFPTLSEILEVLRSMGYRKVAEPTVLPGNRPSGPPPKG